MAKRTTNKKRKNTKRKGRSLSPASYIMIALGVILIAFFIYFLNSLKKENPDIAMDLLAEKLSQENNTQNTVSPPENMLPEKPEDRWSYLECLELQKCDNNVISDEPVDILAQEIERKNVLDIFNGGSDNNTNVAPTRNAGSINNVPSVATTPQVNVTEVPVNTTTVSSVSNASRLQCGAFKNRENAESLKARLIFMGYDSDIITDNSLSRVMVKITSKPATAVYNELQAQGISCSKP